MKLRSLVCLGALAVAGAVCAEIAAPTSNTFGWLRIDSTNQYTIVGVPWLGCDGSAVKVADLVKLDNLTDGDMLYVYSSGSYSAWVKEDNGWTPTTTIAAGKVPAAAEGAADAALARGGALWLYRQVPATDAGLAVPFYVYGKHESGNISAPTLTKKAYNLIANPNATAFDLNGGGIVGASTKDYIQVVGDNGIVRLYTFDGTCWGYKVMTPKEGRPDIMQENRVTTGCTIPAGQGAWYVSNGETAPSITW